MAGHSAGVAKAEINVIVAVNILEMRAMGFCDEDWKFAGPFFHPVHGNAAEKGFLRAGVEGGGERSMVRRVDFFGVAMNGSVTFN
jgi:hypothetical protein